MAKMSGTSPRILFTVVVPFGVGYYISYLFRTVNVVISGSMAEDLKLTAADLGLLTSIYFIIFAVFQTPLGILLDRYGPRRTQVFLLLFAILGSTLFAYSENFLVLSIARGLIGLGVSGCLMAALKANSSWFAAERLPLINGITVAFGSFGALSATVPVEWLFQLFGWRPIFTLLAIFTMMLLLVTWLIVPEEGDERGNNLFSLREQFGELALVYRSPFFWRVSVITLFHNAAFLSYQSLWMGPWLRDVGGFEPPEIAKTLLIFNLGMFIGVICIGAIASKLQSLNIRPIFVLGVGVSASILIQIFFVCELIQYKDWLCFFFGFFGSANLLVYSVLTQDFPKKLTGRVNTASNMLSFVGAFIVQWGIGLVINQWPVRANGNYDPAGHQVAFSLVVFFEICAFIFFVWPRTNGSKG